jgi:creatinine amidohydrolase
MALGVDTYLDYLKCKLARRELERRGVKTVIALPFYWGINICTGSFPGSFHSRPEVLKGVLGHELASFKRWGFNRVFVLSWHGDYLHNCQ